MSNRSRSGARAFEELTGAAFKRALGVYASMHFAPSNPQVDRTFGLLEGNELLALGRIQQHLDGELEVGGFWVDENRRGTGLARVMVEHVLAQLPAGRSVWCIPFEHLRNFYCTFGMKDAEPESAPASIKAKLVYCEARRSAGHYSGVCLLRHSTTKSVEER